MLSIITRREMQGTNLCDNLKKLLETTNQIIMDFFFFFWWLKGGQGRPCVTHLIGIEEALIHNWDQTQPKFGLFDPLLLFAFLNWKLCFAPNSSKYLWNFYSNLSNFSFPNPLLEHSQQCSYNAIMLKFSSTNTKTLLQQWS